MILQKSVVMEMLAAAVPAVLCSVIIGIALTMSKRAWQRATSDKRLWKGRSLWLWLLPVFLLAGMLRAQQVKSRCEQELSLGLDGKTVTLQGKVLEIRKQDAWIVMVLDCRGPAEPEPRTSMDAGLQRIQVYLDVSKAETMSEAETSEAGVDEADILRIGNQIRVRGACASFEEARNPGEFDYRLYYRSLKLNYRMFADTWEMVDGRYNVYRDGLRRMSVWAGAQLELLTADRADAGVFRAMLLGDKSGLPEQIRDMYQRNGIAHLLAVSGLHLSLVSLAAYGVLRKLGAGYGAAGITGGSLLVSYALLTGASPSVVRALIMMLCGFLAAYLGRTYDLLSALGLSAFCILWDSPYLMCQAGVQLSFGAIIGIGWLAPFLCCGESRRVTGFAVSTGMQLMTLPMVLYHFFQYPLYGIFLNLLVVPVVGIVIASGAAGIAAGSISLAAGRFALGSGCGVLRWYEWCCSVSEKLPGSSIIWGRPEFWQIGVYYAVILAAVWRFRGRGKQLALSFLAAVLLLSVVPPAGLEVTFLDVGQGDGICLRTRQTTVFVDGGSSDEKKLGENRIEPFLKSRGIRAVDYWVVSHGDQDHISGLVWMMEEGDIAVSNLILPAAGLRDEVYGRLAALAEKRGSSVFWMKTGDCLNAGSMTISCLYPDSPYSADDGSSLSLTAEEDRNEHSLVLLVDYDRFRMLLTGDMSGDGEKKLTESMPAPDVQVLKVAHHGSRYSTTEQWLNAVTPEWTVISCGRENRYGHPHAETMERLRDHGVSIFETDRDGAVILRTDGSALQWSTWISHP